MGEVGVRGLQVRFVFPVIIWYDQGGGIVPCGFDAQSVIARLCFLGLHAVFMYCFALLYLSFEESIL